MRDVFLDISKAFDEVWHSGLLFKLQAYGVESWLLALLKYCLHNCKQIVVLNGQTSDRRKTNFVLPQGSVFGPLLFFIFINDLPDGITFIVGKGGHTHPPFLEKVLDQPSPPFLRFTPFLEIQDVPTFDESIGKTKVLNNSCNQFVYNF